MVEESLTIDRRQMLKGLGAGAVATGLAGCVGGLGGGGLETTGVVIPQYGLWDTTGPWLVGRDQGFFEDEGLEVEQIDAEGGGGNVRTVVAGDAQIGMATGIAGLMAAYREGTNVKIVSNEINQSSDLFWYGLAGEIDAESVEDVEGLSLGFSSPGSSTNMVALTAAERYGGEAVSIGGPPDANAALEGGEVDLAWSAGQFFFGGVQSGDYNLVFRGNDVEPFGNLSIRVNFVDGALLEDNPDTAEAYFTAQQRALEYAYDNLDEAAEIWGNEIDNDDYDLLRSVIENSYPEEAIGLSDFQGLDAANQVAVDFDFIDDPLSEEELNDLIDTSPVTGSDEF
jgi:NitT/TauT family transport system substrate-binding protein